MYSLRFISSRSTRESSYQVASVPRSNSSPHVLALPAAVHAYSLSRWNEAFLILMLTLLLSQPSIAGTPFALKVKRWVFAIDAIPLFAPIASHEHGRRLHGDVQLFPDPKYLVGEKKDDSEAGNGSLPPATVKFSARPNPYPAH